MLQTGIPRGDHSGEGYLTAEVDGSTTNEINTITGDDANATTGLGITLAGGGDVTTSVSGDIVTVSCTDTNTEYSAGTGMSLDGTTFNCTVSDTDTQLTDEEVEDIAGAMVSGNTETRITVTYRNRSCLWCSCR